VDAQKLMVCKILSLCLSFCPRICLAILNYHFWALLNGVHLSFVQTVNMIYYCQ